MKERKPYEKPEVAFEKNLEVMAANCDPTGDTAYAGGAPGSSYCKADGVCTGVIYS